MLRFYGIPEQGTIYEDTKEVLCDFIINELEMDEEDARAIEFQRVHRLPGRRNESDKPSTIHHRPIPTLPRQREDHVRLPSVEQNHTSCTLYIQGELVK